MKHRIFQLLLPLAFGTALAASAQAQDPGMRMNMIGCLQAGAEPNTYILTSITKGYIRRSTTGDTPLVLARTDDFVLVPEKSTVDLQEHIGQRVKISGWMSSNEYSTTGTAASTTPYGAEPSSPEKTNVMEFKVTKLHRVSGSCP